MVGVKVNNLYAHNKNYEEEYIMPNMQNNNQKPQLDDNNLKVINDQIAYEALLTKKYKDYESMCTDQSLKSLCNNASNSHKQNFENLKNYLDSHQ
jgi:predicted glycosyl hydrolase (DUF1957 family)